MLMKSIDNNLLSADEKVNILNENNDQFLKSIYWKTNIKPLPGKTINEQTEEFIDNTADLFEQTTNNKVQEQKQIFAMK